MGAKTAAELAAELELRRLKDDFHRAERAREEAERAEWYRLLEIAEKPVAEDLRSMGLDVDSAWDLYLIPDSRPKAIPVLLKHLALDYPDRVLEGIANALNDPTARPWWADLREMMLSTHREAVRDRLAATLSGIATRVHYTDLLDFLGNDKLGSNRIYFLRPVNRIGNRISPGQGRAVIETVADDPILGVEANRILDPQRSEPEPIGILIPR
ncbi:hypothetical protein [Nocardioides endophyticus]|uniref:hypothetical protein n=1 Tax=Nocardioides endophyticus TaxID=1353775 RepID=UPI0031E9AD78